MSQSLEEIDCPDKILEMFKNNRWKGGNVLGNRAISQELIDLGNRIRERRQEVRLSQEGLAEQAGISPNTVSRIECGQSAMSVEIFQKLVRILGTDANQLLGGVELPGTESDRLYTMLRRIGKLRQGEQEIVVQTLISLVDGLEKNR